MVLGLSNQLSKQSAEFGLQLRKKEILVEEYAQKIATLQANFEEDVRKAMLVNKYYNIMLLLYALYVIIYYRS